MGDVMTARRLIENSDNAERVKIELQKLNAMVAYAEALTCRRRALLSYFGDQRHDDCGNCDTCTDPPQRFDATEAAKKALSCVYRVGERFGMMYVIEVLRGSKNQRLLELQHDRLSTWGIGADLSALQWENILRQLIHLGYLVQDFTRFGALSLSPTARPVLKGEVEVILGLPRDVVETVEKGKKRSLGKRDYDQALFDSLRALRKSIADEANLPPFVVFSDATLAEMARTKPQDSRQLRGITGVGDHKLQHYGKAFLDAITSYLQESGDTTPRLTDKDLRLSLSDTQRETLLLVREGCTLEEIAARRGLKQTTVAAHLEELYALGSELDLLRFVEADKVPLIRERLQQVGAVSLSLLKEGLPAEISYEDIRLVRGMWGT